VRVLCVVDLVLPLSLRPRSPRGSSPPLRYVLRIGSAKPLLCEAAVATGEEVRTAIAAYVKSKGTRHRAFESMAQWSVHDQAGWLTYVENSHSFARFTVNLSHDGSFNVLPSRGSLVTYDVVPPGHGQLVQALSIGGAEDGSRMHSETSFTMDMLSVEAHSPAASGIHAPTPLRPAGGTGAAAAGGPNLGLVDMLERLGVRFM